MQRIHHREVLSCLGVKMGLDPPQEAGPLGPTALAFPGEVQPGRWPVVPGEHDLVVASVSNFLGSLLHGMTSLLMLQGFLGQSQPPTCL